jgi:hypothetical protein
MNKPTQAEIDKALKVVSGYVNRGQQEFNNSAVTLAQAYLELKARVEKAEAIISKAEEMVDELLKEVGDE